MKFKTQSVFIAILAVVMANFWLGCAPVGNSIRRANGKANGRANGKGTDNKNETADHSHRGTSDSGGGTGVDGKVFESYIVDPTTLPAFKKYVKPLLDNIKDTTDPNSPSFFIDVLHQKTWYIAPIKLEKINKDVLGVSFVNSDTQQIARQTNKEIWIDKKIYDSMTMKAKAGLLLHEGVMTLYLLKFLSAKEICQTSLLVDYDKDNKGCQNLSPYLEVQSPHEKPRKLNKQDNENIRYVVGWILQSATKAIPAIKLMKVLYYKQFDKRFFDPQNFHAGGVDTTQETVNSQKVVDAFEAAKLSDKMPRWCYALSTKSYRRCEVETEVIKNALGKRNGLLLRVSTDGEDPMEFPLFLTDEVNLALFRSSKAQTLLSEAVIEQSEHLQVGRRVHSGVFIFEKVDQDDGFNLRLKSIVVKPAVVTSVDLKRKSICQLETYRVRHFFDDTLIIRRNKSTPEWLERMFAAMPPLVFCSEFNIDH